MASIASPIHGTKNADLTSRRSDAAHRNPVIEVSASTMVPALRGRSVKTGWACLLLAEDDDRREHLAYVAKAGGWEPIACGSVGEAIRQSNRWKTQLATIDLGSMPAIQKAAYLQFASTLASRERLLVISDEPIDGSGEVSARQAGAWTYLPNPDFHEGLADLFAEARAVAEKIAPTTAV